MSQENKGFFNIKELKLKFASLVKSPANRRKFAVKKSNDKIDIDIIKSANKEWTVVKGVLYEPETFDTQGHKMTAEELRKAAYWAMKNGGLEVDIEHNEKITKSKVVELYIPEKDEDLNGQHVKKGSIVIAVEIEEEQLRKAVDDGSITGFSMAGTGFLDEIEKSDDHELLNLFSDFIDNINKSNTEGSVPESNQVLTKEDIVEIVKSTIQEERNIEAEKVSKSAEKEELSDLKKTVENLKEKLLKSEAGKDGADDLKKGEKGSESAFSSCFDK